MDRYFSYCLYTKEITCFLQLFHDGGRYGLRLKRVKKKVKLSMVNITLRKKAVSHRQHVYGKPL